jgi:glycine betaine catabolism B
MKIVDDFLNSVTMFKLVLYCLRAIIVCSIALSFFGFINFNAIYLIISLLVLAVSCFATNHLFSKLLKVDANTESYAITSLILFLIISPTGSWEGIRWLILAGVLGIASKYLIVYRKSHIFNPAVFGAFAIGLLGFPNVSWWVGNIYLSPVLAIAGFLIVRKIGRHELFGAFAVASAATITLVALYYGSEIGPLLYTTLISGTLIFFGTVMLTEPLTMPSTRRLQILYGLIVGILANLPLYYGSFYLTLELSLIIGNIFTFTVNPKFRSVLSLKEKKELARGIYEFEFTKDDNFQFEPGQYAEWTFDHKSPDRRGNRRFFTIASSPLDQTVKIAMRTVSDKPSSFKKALLEISDDDKIFTSNISGDFLMPEDPKKKMVFIAGGIGITPFASMIKYLLDKNEKRGITLFYAAADVQSFVYSELFINAMERMNMKFIKVLSGAKEVPIEFQGEIGFITSEMINKYVPEKLNSIFYISGPNAMVTGYKKMLLKEGVPGKNIKTDYFPGY